MGEEGGSKVGRRASFHPPRPRQQSSIPRAQRLSDGSLLSAVGWQPADHFIPHYRLLSDLTRFPRLYAALAYDMCIPLPSCQENPRSCPSTVQEPRWHASLASLATLAPRLWGKAADHVSKKVEQERRPDTTSLHENPANFSTSPNLPPSLSTPPPLMACVKWKARRGAAKMKSTPENSSGAAPSLTGGGLLSGNTSQESSKVVGRRLPAQKVEGGEARLDASVLQRARMETFGPFEHSDWVKVNDGGGGWDFFNSSGELGPLVNEGQRSKAFQPVLSCY